MNLIELIAVAGVAGGVSGATIIWLLKNWLLTRLTASVKHEYDEKLARVTGELQRVASTQAAAQSAFAQNHLVAQQKRLEAISDVWRSFLQTRNNQPFLLSIVEMCQPAEYGKLFAQEQMKQYTGELSPQGVAKFARSRDSNFELARPFVGEYLWSLLFAYEAVCTRTTLLLWKIRSNESDVNWFEDEITVRVIQSALTDGEFRDFQALEFGKISYFRTLVEQKFLAASARIINGEASTDIALHEGQRILKAANNLFEAGKTPT